MCFLSSEQQHVSDCGQIIAHLIRQVTQPSPCVKVNKAIFFIAVSSVIRGGHGQEKIGSFVPANNIASLSLRMKTSWKDFIRHRCIRV